jgi:hypothetical protein
MPKTKKSNSQKPTTSGEAVKMEADNAKLSLAKGHEELPSVNTEGEKEDKTLSNLSSGDTKQRGPIRAQDDIKLQIERSASLAADNQPSVCLKKLLEQIGINPRNCFLDNKNNLIIPCSETGDKMNELQELHIKGELAEKGYLKETYDNELDDLKHELTDLGRMEVRDLFKDIRYRQEFMKLALEEAKKHPECSKEIVQAAVNKVKEYS